MDRQKQHKTFVKGVSLRPEDWATIDAHAKDAGLISRSAGLRSILAEWQQMKSTPDKPTIPDSPSVPELLAAIRRVSPQGDLEEVMAEWRRGAGDAQ